MTMTELKAQDRYFAATSEVVSWLESGETYAAQDLVYDTDDY
jgi:hypothetical protein